VTDSMAHGFAPLLDALCQGMSLTQEQSRALFEQIVQGKVPPVTLSALLTALKAKGETAAEIAGAAEALRASAVAFQRPERTFADACGTGGDGSGTFNVSTAVAFVAAAGGLAIVKHGNRSVSSRCGSADVLEALSVVVELDADVARRLLDQTGFCFLFAPRMHPGIRFAMPVRKELGVRTIFNILGPLVNPACPDVQLLGTGLRAWVSPMAETLRLLGTRAALVVHGDGTDEIALHAETHAAHLVNGTITNLVLRPEDVGLTRAPLLALRGGEPEDNAKALLALLSGGAKSNALNAFRDAVAFNAGALFWVADVTPSIAEGVKMALSILSSGRAFEIFDHYRKASQHV
jgi:anthranilate phosphoribosyltransferase